MIMLLGQPPGGWPGTNGLGLNPMLTRFGPYQLQPYALPAFPAPSPIQPTPATAPSPPPARPRWGGWNGGPLPPLVDPFGWGANGSYQQLDPRLAHLLRLHQQFGQPMFGLHGGGEGGQGPRGGVGSVGGGGGWHDDHGYHGGGFGGGHPGI
jgi:hypothetical protein